MIFWPPWAAWLQSSHRYPAPDTRRTWLRSLSREVPIPGGWRPRETLNTATTSQRLRGEVRASARLVITSTNCRGKCVAKCVAKLREAESEQLHREAQRGREGVPCSLATSLTSSWVQIRLALCLSFWHNKNVFFYLYNIFKQIINWLKYPQFQGESLNVELTWRLLLTVIIITRLPMKCFSIRDTGTSLTFWISTAQASISFNLWRKIHR